MPLFVTGPGPSVPVVPPLPTCSVPAVTTVPPRIGVRRVEGHRAAALHGHAARAADAGGAAGGVAEGVGLGVVVEGHAVGRDAARLGDHRGAAGGVVEDDGLPVAYLVPPGPLQLLLVVSQAVLAVPVQVAVRKVVVKT